MKKVTKKTNLKTYIRALYFYQVKPGNSVQKYGLGSSGPKYISLPIGVLTPIVLLLSLFLLTLVKWPMSGSAPIILLIFEAIFVYFLYKNILASIRLWKMIKNGKLNSGKFPNDVKLL